MSRPKSTAEIEKIIAEAQEGEAFITSDFLHVAGVQAVNTALSRLTEEGAIRRVIRGVYDKPIYSELLGEFSVPHIEKVALALARNYGWDIAPCGDTALNLLGLSTQVPAVWLYVSTGPYKTYEIGNTKLQFKHAANKDLAGISYKSALVIQALKAIGENQIDDDMIRKLSGLLSVSDKIDISREAQHTTTWVYTAIKKICENG